MEMFLKLLPVLNFENDSLNITSPGFQGRRMPAFTGLTPKLLKINHLYIFFALLYATVSFLSTVISNP